MTLQESHQPVTSAWIGWSLRGNALFSLISGLSALLGARPLAVLIGLPGPTPLTILGGGLVIYAALLFWAASQRPIDRRVATAAVILDMAWVFGSALLLLAGWVPFTTAGKWVVLIVADVVALFAALQFYGLWQARSITE